MKNYFSLKALSLNPQKIFLIDGCGAILSAFSLGVVLVKLTKIFGIPASTLYLLAALAISFAMYDFYCYFTKGDKLSQYLKGIAIINLLYGCLSIGFMFYHFDSITSLGYTYILVEVLIVASLAIFEFKTAKKLETNL